MILVTHTDLDGVGCEIVARCFYREKLTTVHHCDYAFVNYTVTKILNETEEELMISDVSITDETGRLINEKYPGRVQLYDHHGTAEAYLKDYQWCSIDTSRSATKLMFDVLRHKMPANDAPVGLPAFVHYVNDYDLWHQTTPHSTRFNDLLSILGLTKFAEIMLDRLNNDKALINDQDRIYLEAHQEKKIQYFKERLSQATVIKDRLVVLASRHLSDFSQYIRDTSTPQNWENVKYIDMINLERGSHSLRSYDLDFDVSKIAEKNGGGGHPKAAGYPIKQLNAAKLAQF